MENKIYSLIPHREPMLLIDSLISVNESSSEAELSITNKSSFYTEGLGVPSWIGVEYMGQTAALIAGHQLELGTVEPHIGLLLGTRKYSTTTSWFTLGSTLRVSCEQIALVGNNLATFLCNITDQKTSQVLANAKLSVFRKDRNDNEGNN